MERINYTVTALEPLMHGADNATMGNKRMFRRERHKLLNPQREISVFESDESRRKSALVLLFGIYKSIDNKLKSDYYGFYEQFSANIVAATHNRTRFEFFNVLCEMCGIRTVTDKYYSSVMVALESFSDAEFMYTMKHETQYLMLMLRDFVKHEGDPTMPQNNMNAEKRIFVQQFVDVPFISGNAIGGILRRLAIRDYFQRIGYDKEKHGLSKSVYHELMTGGNISESTGTVSIDKKEKYALLCPPVGVLGSALGNMTTASVVKIGSLRPVCAELGSIDSPSFWEMLGTQFGTRHDTSKAEMDVHIDSNTDDRNADQMIYHNEVLNAGTVLRSDMLLVSDDELQKSCFWHMASLWKEFGYIAGRSARGYGRVNVDIRVPDGATELYISHLETVKEDALKFFTVERK